MPTPPFSMAIASYRALPLSVVLLVLAASGDAHAQVTKNGSAYQFRIKFVKGNVLKYKTLVSNGSSGAGFAVKVIFPVVETVVGVKGDIGDLVIKSGPMSFNGKAAGSVQSYRMQVDSRGKLVGGQIASNSGITVFPSKPIHPGQKWTASVPMTAGGFVSGGSGMVTATYRFVRMTTYKGKAAAQLGITFKGRGTTSVDGNGTSFVLASDGDIVYSSIKMDIAISKDMQPVAMNVEVTRS